MWLPPHKKSVLYVMEALFREIIKKHNMQNTIGILLSGKVKLLNKKAINDENVIACFNELKAAGAIIYQKEDKKVPQQNLKLPPIFLIDLYSGRIVKKVYMAWEDAETYFADEYGLDDYYMRTQSAHDADLKEQNNNIRPRVHVDELL